MIEGSQFSRFDARAAEPTLEAFAGVACCAERQTKLAECAFAIPPLRSSSWTASSHLPSTTAGCVIQVTEFPANQH